jgi:hypothetical protein
VAENNPVGTSVGDPVAATHGHGRELTYSMSGEDADQFEVDSQTGQISVGQGTVLDYESPDKAYSVTVGAKTGQAGEVSSIDVTISVTNVDEDGSITLSPDGVPEVGTTITATLADPDGDVADVSWQWQRSSDGATWTDIPDAASAEYTPSEDDLGMMLRATATYSDAAGTEVSLGGEPSLALPSPPEVTPTPTPTVPPTPTATPTATPEPTAEPTATPIATPTATLEPVATLTPTAAPTVEPTAAPTVAPPTPAPTVAPTTVVPEALEDEGGFPAWAFIVIIIGVLAGVGIIVLVVRSRAG